ncbi:MAG: D-aminoacyl-tRNA deacylase [Acidobacteriota bacterium]
MRAVLQRVSRAKVTVNGETTGDIGAGILVLLGVGTGDVESDAYYLVEKIINLRIFDDEAGKMNRSLIDISGGLLVVSQFTLYGDVRRGRRPSYIEAAPPKEANRLYEFFVEQSRQFVSKVETGRFQAMMDVELVNDGPVTIILDTSQAK